MSGCRGSLPHSVSSCWPVESVHQVVVPDDITSRDKECVGGYRAEPVLVEVWK